ncbi:hypothetical protein ITZ57_002101 [Escherichia coli]|nr:hypothetical protein [Escherichia coli]
MSMYTTAQLLAANEQKFKFDPLFLRLFFRESYPFTTEKVYLSQIPGLVTALLHPRYRSRRHKLPVRQRYAGNW